MWPIVRDRVVWCVCRSVTLVSPAKTAGPVEMPFGFRTRVGPRIHVLDGVQIPYGRGNFHGKADLSPLAAANELVCCLRCGGIIAHVERVNSSSQGVRCGLFVKLLWPLVFTVATRYAETCHFLFSVSRCQQNQRSLAADISYKGSQNGTKFGTLIDGALLYVISSIGELWRKGSPGVPKNCHEMSSVVCNTRVLWPNGFMDQDAT